jgi:TPR repeat protein
MNIRQLTILLAFTSLIIFSVVSKVFFNDFQSGWDAYVKKDYKIAYELWLPLAEKGDSKAQFFLGFMHDLGFGTLEDDKEALQWYQRAAEQGDSRAQLFTGFIYDLGRGVAKDSQEAFKWYQLAAKAGFHEAKTKIYDLAVKNNPQAMKVLKADAENGIAEAQFVLASMHDNGQGVPQNYQKSFKWYQLAAKAGFHEAKTKIYDLAVKNIPQALQVLIDDSENGIAEAQFVLASMHVKGQGVPQNYQEAMKWYFRLLSKQDYYLVGIDTLKRATQNDLKKVEKIILGKAMGYVNVKVRSTLGIMHTNENEVLQTRNAAEKWYRLADAQQHKAKTNIYNLAKKNVPQAMKVLKDDAENGVAEAQFVFASMYAEGLGIIRDRNEADKWYRLAEAQEHKEKKSIYNLAKKNDLQAIQVLKDDAENGIAEAQFVLASMYAKGQGVPQNYQKAMNWFYRLAERQATNKEEIKFYYDWRKSNIPQVLKFLANDAEKGIAKAQNNLGMIYAHGKYVPKDDQQAIKWYRLAAEKGSFRAKYNLGEMYAKGRGVPKNEQRASKWFHLYIEDCRGINKYIEPSKKNCFSVPENFNE